MTSESLNVKNCNPNKPYPLPLQKDCYQENSHSGPSQPKGSEDKLFVHPRHHHIRSVLAKTTGNVSDINGISSSLLFRMGIRSIFLGTSLFGFCLWWEHPDYIKWIDGKYAGKYEYLTYLGVASTIGTIFASSVNDLFHYYSNLRKKNSYPQCKSNVQTGNGDSSQVSEIPQAEHSPSFVFSSYSSRLSELRNWMLAISFPVETLITIFYWSLRFYDHTLLSSASLIRRGSWTPIESDLSNHLFPFFYVWIELLLFSQFTSRPFVRKWVHKLVLVAINGAYMAWSHFLFLQNKKWVYPLLGKLSTSQHFGLVALTSSFTIVSYWIGTTLLHVRA